MVSDYDSLCRGEIAVESKIEDGSTFAIKLLKLRNDGMNTE